MGLDTNLVTYYSLDEVSGTRFDAHGSDDLTDNNTVTSGTGKQGNAASFASASSEYLSVASSTNNNPGDADFTISLWLSPASVLANFATWNIFGKFISNTNGSYSLRIQNFFGSYSYTFNVTDSAGSIGTIAASSGALSAGTWVHIVLGHDSINNQLFIYFNGTPVTPTAWSTGVRSSTVDLLLGTYANGPGPVLYFNGLIDEFAIWHRVLTSTEVTDLYNSGSGRDYAYVSTPGGGGTTYTDYVTDGAKQSDTLSTQTSQHLLVSDGSKQSDTLATQATFSLSVMDGAKQSDTLSEQLSTTSSVSDGGIQSDTLANQASVIDTLTDGGVQSDALSTHLSAINSITDGSKQSDLLSTQLTANNLIIEGSKQSDSLSTVATFHVGVSDGSVSIEGFTDGANTVYTVFVTDGAKSSDTLATQATFTLSLSDGSKQSDTPATQLSTTSSVSDGGKSGDTDVGLLTITKTVADGAKSGDATTNQLSAFSQVTDGSKQSDTVATQLTANISITEGSKQSDSLSTVILTTVYIADGSVISDAVTTQYVDASINQSKTLSPLGTRIGTRQMRDG